MNIETCVTFRIKGKHYCTCTVYMHRCTSAYIHAHVYAHITACYIVLALECLPDPSDRDQTIANPRDRDEVKDDPSDRDELRDNPSDRDGRMEKGFIPRWIRDDPSDRDQTMEDPRDRDEIKNNSTDW